jgi:hypothetical protein
VTALRRFALAAAAGLVLATPAAAQQATAQENLDCAIWAAYQLGMAENETMQSGFSIAVAWFIGLYEGQTGRKIDAAMAARTAEMDEAMIEQLTEPCIARFSDFADRLGKMGEGLGAGGQ